MELIKIPNNTLRTEWSAIINGSDNWFALDTIHYWGTRVLWDSLTFTETEGVFLFITEEDNFERSERILTIRMFVPNRGITTMTYEPLSRQEAEHLLAIGSSGNLAMLEEIAKAAWDDSVRDLK